jgi:hypothetical protein
MGMLPRHCTYEKHKLSVQKIVSVSTKFATFPSSSIPLALKRVPALRHDNREISVIFEGIPADRILAGEEAAGIVTVAANPRIAEVKIRDSSNTFRSFGESLDRKSTKG